MHTNNMKKASLTYINNEIIQNLIKGQKTSTELAEALGVDKVEVLASLKKGMSEGAIRKTKQGFAGAIVYELSVKAKAALARVAAETNLAMPEMTVLATLPAEVAPAPTVETVVAAPKQLLTAPVGRRGVVYAPGYVDQMRAAFEAELPVMAGVERDYIGRRFVGLLGEGFTVSGARAHLARYVRVVAEHTASVLAAAAIPASEQAISDFVDAQKFARVASLD